MYRGLGAVCDGDVEVRKAARDELRKGAHCIKIMGSREADGLTPAPFGDHSYCAYLKLQSVLWCTGV